MKNQIMEHSIGVGLTRKYAAVKLMASNKSMPVAVIHMPFNKLQLEFIEQKGGQEFYMVIDCKAYEIAVSVRDIETLEETKDGKIAIVYTVPDEDGNPKRFNELYDCFETEDILRTFVNINTNQMLKEKKTIKK